MFLSSALRKNPYFTAQALNMKNIIVTGANGNLGVAVVKRILADGNRVIAVGSSGNTLGFAKDNSNFELHDIDLTKHEEAWTFSETVIEKYGQIDGAALLVGGFAMGNIADMQYEDMEKMIRLNFATAFNVAKPLFNHMLSNNNGKIVFIGAKPALEPHMAKNMIAYSLSKSLLFSFAEILNASADGKNVNTSVVVPQTIDTPQNRKDMPDADFSKWSKPENIAEVFSFIFNEKSNVVKQAVYKLY